MSDGLNPYQSPPAGSAGSAEGQPADPRSSLQNTRRGLSLVYYGIVTTLLSLIAAVAGRLISLPADDPPFLLVFGFAGIGLIAGLLLTLIGPLFCLTVPRESGARGLIIAVVALQLAGCAAVFLPRGPAPLPAMAALAATALFALFLKRLACYVARPDLAAGARSLLIGGAVLLVSLGLITHLIFSKAGGALEDMLGLAVGIGFLIVFVLYANLINSLRRVLL